ncbi:hypothetical protein B0H67DRAFT_655549 [Lasiosphaeris hirsuta]|uniref:RING-type domain-containing protein n=1 Tax=Lasiosphaeris hirsuta TaxID=260670 RepID=A0AA40BDD7_9PEZI|nr:hypothetical protein B0H67DRAFT_655549 [Lasiosphaeris hirsuta]
MSRRERTQAQRSSWRQPQQMSEDEALAWALQESLFTSEQGQPEETVEETYWPTIEKYLKDKRQRRHGPKVVVNCIICLTQVTVPSLQPQNGERERGAMLLPCQHIVGTNCGVTWVRESENLDETERGSKCPICRARIRDVKQCLEADEKLDRHNQIVQCRPSWR